MECLKKYNKYIYRLSVLLGEPYNKRAASNMAYCSRLR